MPDTNTSEPVRADSLEPQHSTELARLQSLDTMLIAELLKKQPRSQPSSETTRIRCQNEAIAELLKNDYSADELKTLERQLHDRGTTMISTVKGYSVRIDGTSQPVSFVCATELTDDTPNHGEMASMLYLRDHIQTASMLMELYLNDPTCLLYTSPSPRDS